MKKFSEYLQESDELTPEVLQQLKINSRGIPGSPKQKTAIADIDKMDIDQLKQVIKLTSFDPIMRGYAINKLKKLSNIELPYAESVMGSYHFETGKSITFPYIRNTEKSPNMGQRFQQDIEPYGTYLSFNGENVPPPTPTWKTGKITLKNPLVVLWNTQGGGYDQNSWKAIISRYYSAKGLELSKALKLDGYDGIVTINAEDNRPSEIVKL